MNIQLIFARAANGVIGKDNAMPWHLPEDLAHFKRTTMGAPVIMGRKTWDSLPPKFRPLPGRPNVVVTRQTDWLHHAGNPAGVQCANGLGQALDQLRSHADVWVIGGAEIYEQALPLASKAVVTEIEANFPGDAFAPQFGPKWTETMRESHVSSTGLQFSFVTYTRKEGD